MNITIPENKDVAVIGISVKVQCPKCLNIWGVYLDHEGNFPPRWSVCRKCAENAIIEGMVNFDRKQSC